MPEPPPLTPHALQFLPSSATNIAIYFPALPAGVRIIAEPGRYFAETIATMGCMVYGRRVRVEPGANAGAEMPAVSR